MTQTADEATMAEDTAEGLKDAIRVDTAELRGHVDAVVRSSVEETLNALLQAEADAICGATRYERSGAPRHPRWQLRAEARNEGGGGEAEGAEAALAALRDGDH